MHIDISAQHTQLTPALEAAVHDKFQRLEAHASKSLRVHVVLLVDGDRHQVDATVRGVGKPLVARAQSENMYTAINEAAHLLDRQWRKRKTSRISARQTGSIKRGMS